MKKFLAVILAVMMIASLSATAFADTLRIAVDTNASADGLQAVIDKAREDIGVDVEIEIRPGGDEGDNMVKAWIAAGEFEKLTAAAEGFTSQL